MVRGRSHNHVNPNAVHAACGLQCGGGMTHKTKQTPKKLPLARTTLKRLDDAGLAAVHGGTEEAPIETLILTRKAKKVTN
jgi:hypothetical protein